MRSWYERGSTRARNICVSLVIVKGAELERHSYTNLTAISLQ